MASSLSALFLPCFPVLILGAAGCGTRPDGAAAPASAERRQQAAAAVAEGQKIKEEKGLAAAAEIFSRALELDPGSDQAGILLAECQVETERYQDALGTLTRIEGLLPPDPSRAGREKIMAVAKATYLKGRALKELGRFDEAEAALRRSVAVNPNNAASRFLLAGALAALGRHEEAVGNFREALTGMEAAGFLNGREQLHFQLANSLKALGRNEEAALHLRLYKQLQETISRIAHLERMALNRPGSGEAFRELGCAQYCAGQVREAFSSFSQAVRNDSSDPVSLAGLGICLLLQRRANEGSPLVARSLSLRETSWGLYGRALDLAMRDAIGEARQAIAGAAARAEAGDPLAEEISKLRAQLDGLPSR
jgi:tetratricopeptide (TPR) repeat protein